MADFKTQIVDLRQVPEPRQRRVTGFLSTTPARSRTAPSSTAREIAASRSRSVSAAAR